MAEPYFVLSNELAQPVFSTEYYELVRGNPAGGAGGAGGPEGERADGRETDLFAGIETAGVGTAGAEEAS